MQFALRVASNLQNNTQPTQVLSTMGAVVQPPVSPGAAPQVNSHFVDCIAHPELKKHAEDAIAIMANLEHPEHHTHFQAHQAFAATLRLIDERIAQMEEKHRPHVHIETIVNAVKTHGPTFSSELHLTLLHNKPYHHRGSECTPPYAIKGPHLFNNPRIANMLGHIMQTEHGHADAPTPKPPGAIKSS